jgi:hypothetical protein
MKMRAEGHIARGGVERESTVEGPPSESLSEQYSLAKILGTCGAADGPARLGDRADDHPSHLPLHPRSRS